jgi:hypothetical protein
MLINIQEIYLALAGCVAAAFPLTRRSVLVKLRQPVVWVIGLGVLIGLAFVCTYNALRFGNPLDTGRTAVPHPLLGVPLVGLYGLVVSPAKSVILYSPPIVLALVGLRRMMANRPGRFAPVFGCLALHLALVSSLRFWAGEWAWGPRYLVASLPLACIGLPYAWPEKERRTLKLLVCGLGFAVQVLAISVDHHRFYYERSLSSFFWTDESIMYKQSPLFSRPFELIEIIEGRDLAGVRALTPAIRPMSMTSSTFAPPEEAWKELECMRSTGVRGTRPWTLWSRYLPEELRPGPTDDDVDRVAVAALSSAYRDHYSKAADGPKEMNRWLRPFESRFSIQSLGSNRAGACRRTRSAGHHPQGGTSSSRRN